jgi:3-mercaptopyruvate sulfurtransferase SseA
VVTTKTTYGNALVGADELKTWIDAGLVNKKGGYDRVVILDVTADASGSVPSANKYYTDGHIPGAQLISTGTAAFMDETRAEGPLNLMGNMVCKGSQMDALIQKTGIDANTTIVLTTQGTTVSNVTRPYATFRYWGFPKNRIKILYGGNVEWLAKYPLNKDVPSITPSTYGVAQNGTTKVNTEMRASLGEMIGYVNGIVAGNTDNVYILDTIRPTTHITSTTDIIGDKLTAKDDFTPFDGAMRGSYRYPGSGVVTSGLKFKTADELKAAIDVADYKDGLNPAVVLGLDNRTSAKTFIALCRAGNLASQAYFALDGIAYYDSSVDIKWYDGSYGQWNLMATTDATASNTAVPAVTVSAGGKLKAGSIWDTTSLMYNLTWNVGRVISTTDTAQRTIIDYTSRVYTVEPTFEQGNQIETEDKAYRSTVINTSGGTVAAGGGGC